jgi:hypothetical protein
MDSQVLRTKASNTVLGFELCRVPWLPQDQLSEPAALWRYLAERTPEQLIMDFQTLIIKRLKREGMRSKSI